MPAEKLRRRPDLLEKSLGDEILLYNGDGGMIHILNVTAQIIWALCDGEHTVVEMAQTLAARFDLSEQLIVLECDVKETLALFSQKDLLDS